MAVDRTRYEVDVYVDSTGRYHLPLTWRPHFGPPRQFAFGDGVTGYALTTHRSSDEPDHVVFVRAYDELTAAGFAVPPPRPPRSRR